MRRSKTLDPRTHRQNPRSVVVGTRLFVRFSPGVVNADATR